MNTYVRTYCRYHSVESEEYSSLTSALMRAACDAANGMCYDIKLECKENGFCLDGQDYRDVLWHVADFYDY